MHRQVGDAARMWEAGGREPSDLYRGARLAAAADWAQVHRGDLNATERNFIDASVAEADRERRTQLRANRRLRGLLAGAVTLLLVAVLAGVVALIQRGDARAQALTSDAERIGAQALTEQDVDRSLLLGVAAVKLQNRVQTRSDLFAALQQNPALIRLIRPADFEITALRVSPDGRLLAVADASGAVRFIDLDTWKPNRSGRESRRAGGRACPELLSRWPHAHGADHRCRALDALCDRCASARGPADSRVERSRSRAADRTRGRRVLA